MHKSLQQGFSFLELMIVLALIGMLGAFVVPNVFRTKQGAQRKEFLVQFEALLKDAVLRSITKNMMHQIFIDIEHEKIQTRVFQKNAIETNQHKSFVKIEDVEYLTEIVFPKYFIIKDFFINGIQELVPGNMVLDVVFYVMPDGTSQAIVANLIDEEEEGITPDIKFSFVINPFYARMSVHESFQTP